MNTSLRPRWRHALKWPALALFFGVSAWITILLSPTAPHTHIRSLAARVLVCSIATAGMAFVTLPGVRYFVVAWLLGQIAGHVAQDLGASATASILLRALVMLPFMLLFAWHSQRAARRLQRGIEKGHSA